MAYLYGSGAIEKTGDFCRELGLKGNAVLVVDSITWGIAGARISEILKSHDFKKVEAIMIEKGAIKSEFEKVHEKVRSIGASVVFGIGGGVNMDIAKASASAEEGVQSVTVPTSIAQNAMTPPIAVFWDSSSWTRPTIKPVLACIVDVDIIKKAPWRLTASGFGDCLERVSGIRDFELACLRGKEFTKGVSSEMGLAIAKLQAELLMKNAVAIRAMDDKAFDLLIQACVFDGTIMELVRPAWIFGSGHQVANGITDHVKVLHGEAVGVGTILMVCLQSGNWKAVKKAMEDVGAKVTAKQLGVSDETVIKALVDASERANTEEYMRTRYTILNEKPLTEDSARSLARKTGVIE